VTDREEFREEVEDAVEIVKLETGATQAAIEKATIDQQIVTAHAYPRSMQSFLNELKEFATMDQETASSCFYSLKRANKKIEGPSVRMAELIGYCFGNLRTKTTIISVDEETITVEGWFYDLERNRAYSDQVTRGISDRHGRRYSADMIRVTANAASAIAFRNAVMKGVPRSLWKSIIPDIRKAMLGKGTMEEKRKAAAAWFGERGVSEARVLGYLEVKGWADVGEEELIDLRGVITAVNEGETTINELFPREGSTPTTAADDLTRKIQEKEASPQPPAGEDSGSASAGPGPDESPAASLPPKRRKTCAVAKCINPPASDSVLCRKHRDEKAPPAGEPEGQEQGELL